MMLQYITNEPSCNEVISTSEILFITCITDACAVFHCVCLPELKDGSFGYCKRCMIGIIGYCKRWFI